MPRRRTRTESGVVAVEFALILPLLLILVFGLIDFGRMLNAQITLTQAAHEGARFAALGKDGGEIQTRVDDAAAPLTNVQLSGESVLCPLDPQPNSYAVIKITYTFSFATPLSALTGSFGSPLTLSARGVVQCQG